MNFLRKLGPLSLLLLLTGFGCTAANVTEIDVTTGETVEETVLEDNATENVPTTVDLEPTGTLYENEYGYSFRYSNELVIWSELDEKLNLIPATTEDRIINVAYNDVGRIGNTEVNTITFTIADTSMAPEEWARKEIFGFDYIETLNNDFGEENSFKFTDVQGKNALEIIGEGNLGSKYRTIVIDLGSKLLIVEQGLPDDLFTDVSNSLELN